MPEDAFQPIHHPHDHLFKEVFGRPDVALDLARAYLPPKLAVAIESLRREPATFVDERLRARS